MSNLEVVWLRVSLGCFKSEYKHSCLPPHLLQIPIITFWEQLGVCYLISSTHRRRMKSPAEGMNTHKERVSETWSDWRMFIDPNVWAVWVHLRLGLSDRFFDRRPDRFMFVFEVRALRLWMDGGAMFAPITLPLKCQCGGASGRKLILTFSATLLHLDELHTSHYNVYILLFPCILARFCTPEDKKDWVGFELRRPLSVHSDSSEAGNNLLWENRPQHYSYILLASGIKWGYTLRNQTRDKLHQQQGKHQ